MNRPLLALLSLAALLTSCGGGLRQFPEREPMAQDDDRRAFTPRPEEYFSPFAWDAVDQTIFRPITRLFAVDPGGEAVNVNALDEVPESSWWTNRIGERPMSIEEFVRAGCEDFPPLDPSGPWTVTDAKPNGANPGFIIEGPDETKYLLKFDGLLQPERATSADVFGSIVYHAAGYHAPCNRVVFFDPAVLRIASDATAENEAGEEVPLTRGMIDLALEKGPRLPDGRVRASSSRFLPGRPIGPFTYQGTLDEDPNDVIPHEDRRELRGGYVIASWLNHFDAREQNTLAVWMEDRDADDGRGYVRHYYIDFGDCFGSLWDWDGISRRLGYGNYLDLPDVAVDFATFGLLRRPWEYPRAQYGATGRILGYYGGPPDRFEPDAWDPGYPNPAFSRHSERDGAWMARILAHIRDEHIQAAIHEVHISGQLLREELLRILIDRRDRILRRWFRNLSPLTHPTVEATSDGARLCLRDLSVYAGVSAPEVRRYRSQAWAGTDAAPIAVSSPRRGRDEQVCVDLPAVSRSGASEYLIVDVSGFVEDPDEQGPARVHMYHRGGADYLVVGLERPTGHADPG